MLLPIILSLIAGAFLFAYLYKSTPETSPFFKILYVSLALFFLFSTSWVSLHSQDFSTAKYTYNATGSLVTKEITNYSMTEPMKNFITTNNYAIIIVTLTVLFTLVIMYIWNLFVSASEQRFERNAKGY